MSASSADPHRALLSHTAPTLGPISPDSEDRLYLRPTGFVSSPIGLDGCVERLAGGLCYFSAYEVIAARDGRRRARWLIPVDQWAERLSREAQTRLAPLRAAITQSRPPLQLGARTIRLGDPQVMAILNLTPDSFSDGGRFWRGKGDAAALADEEAIAAAVEWAGLATAMGAAIIDVGGESTRPGAQPVWEGDEIARVIPVIQRLARCGTAVSIDTRKAAVMEAALAAGAALLNDVSGLCHDPRALDVARSCQAPIVLMHSADPAGSLHGATPRSAPADKQGANGTAIAPDVVLTAYDWFEQRLTVLEAAGITRARVILDPGIGFGRSLAENLMLINDLALFHALGAPILLGASRKRLIGALSSEEGADDRLGGSLALALEGIRHGVQIIRAHDVAETVQALRIWRGLRDAALTAP